MFRENRAWSSYPCPCARFALAGRAAVASVRSARSRFLCRRELDFCTRGTSQSPIFDNRNGGRRAFSVSSARSASRYSMSNATRGRTRCIEESWQSLCGLRKSTFGGALENSLSRRRRKCRKTTADRDSYGQRRLTMPVNPDSTSAVGIQHVQIC